MIHDVQVTKQNFALLLKADWLQKLVEDEFRVIGMSKQSEGMSRDAPLHSFRLADGASVTVNTVGDEIAATVDDARKSKRLRELVDDANRLGSSGEMGDPAWWKIVFSTGRFGPINFQTPQGMRVLGEQTFLVGTHRVGYQGIVDFEPRLPTGAAGDVPSPDSGAVLDVRFAIRTTGPTHGFLAGDTVRTIGALLHGLTVFATGIRADPAAPWPAKPELIEHAEQALSGQLPEFSALRADRKTWVALWPPMVAFMQHAELGLRIRNFLGSYSTALDQSSAETAVMFLVSAIEALTVPNTKWRSEQILKRFWTMLLELCPSALDEVMRHANFKSAFGNRQTPASFAKHLYALRSAPAHGTLAPRRVERVPSDMAGQVRIGLVSEVAREAFLAFMSAPRSSLVGHPLYVDDQPEISESRPAPDQASEEPGAASS